MKKRMITGLLAAVMAITLTVPAGGIKAEAKLVAPSARTSDFYFYLSQEEYTQMYNTAMQIVASAPTAPHDKVKYFHDEICKRNTYSTDVNIKTGMAYGGLVAGKTKCTGYAAAFRELCELADIPCYEIGGYSNGVAHAWNVVQLEDGQWYEVDCTYDDTYDRSKISYNWFLLTTEQMSKDHKRDEGDLSYPIANGTLYALPGEDENNAKDEGTDKDEHYLTKVNGAVFVTDVANGTCTLEDLPQNRTSFTVPDVIMFKGHKLIVDTIELEPSKFCKLKSIVIGKSIKKIAKNSFKGCRSLKRITIKSTDIKVGKNAFKDISDKATFRLPKSKFNAYKRLLKKKAGAPRSSKFKKVK